MSRWLSEKDTFVIRLTIGLVARELKAVGFEVNIVDLNHAVLSNIDGFVANRENFEKIFVQELEGYMPDIVGVTCMFTITHESFSQTIRRLSLFNKHSVSQGVFI